MEEKKHAPEKDIKTAIIEQTYKMIRENPDITLKVSEICDACSISKGSFYYYYSSIDDVIDSITSILENRITKEMPSILKEKNCVLQILRVFQAMHTAISEMGYGIAARRYILGLKRTRDAFPTDEAGWDIVLALLEKAVASGELVTDFKPCDLAETCFLLIRGISYTWCMQAGNFDLVQKNQSVLRNYLALFQP